MDWLNEYGGLVLAFIGALTVGGYVVRLFAWALKMISSWWYGPDPELERLLDRIATVLES